MLGTAISRRDLPFPPESLEVDTLYKLSSIYSYAMTHHQPAHGLVLGTAHLVLGWFRKQLTCFRPGIGNSRLGFGNMHKIRQAVSKTSSRPSRLLPKPDQNQVGCFQYQIMCIIQRVRCPLTSHRVTEYTIWLIQRVHIE